MQHVVSVMAEWLVPQVQKAKNGARFGHGHSAKSFTLLWTFQIPIRVSEHHDTLLYLLPAATIVSFLSINLLTSVFSVSYNLMPSSQDPLASVYSDMLTSFTCHGKCLARSVTVVFLSLLLILAGDVELNPGPGKGKEKATSG